MFKFTISYLHIDWLKHIYTIKYMQKDFGLDFYFKNFTQTYYIRMIDPVNINEYCFSIIVFMENYWNFFQLNFFDLKFFQQHFWTKNFCRTIFSISFVSATFFYFNLVQQHFLSKFVSNPNLFHQHFCNESCFNKIVSETFF